MNPSEVTYHLDEDGGMIIAERNGTAIGMLPWSISGDTAYLYQSITDNRYLRACVATDERESGIGAEMASLFVERYPAEDGWRTETGGRDDWLDNIDAPDTDAISTIEVTETLKIAQGNLDRILAE